MKLLTDCAPDTLMGRLLRSFWQPVAVLAEVPPSSARGLRLLGEELTLFRGESGTPYLIGGRCAHRCTVLHTGWVQGEQIRCMYHGWRYDGTGTCTEMPAERRMTSARIAGYPVREYCGLVFTYLGEGPTPEFSLPRKDELEEPGRHVVCVPPVVWDTNWFQLIENSLDAAHVSFVHAWGRAERFSEEVTTAIPHLAYAETTAGMRQTATRGAGNVRVSDWTFPNNNHIIVPGRGPTDPWLDLFAWVVPIDDEHMVRFVLASFGAGDEDATRRVVEEYTTPYNPMEHYDLLFNRHQLPDVSGVRLIATQDYAAARGQGRVVDRTRERLGQSDAGIAMLRKIFWRELDALGAGASLKAWSKLAQRAELPTPVRRPTRKHALAAFGAAALVGGPRRAPAQTSTTIRVGAYPTDTYAEPFFALDSGIFRRAGLNVELVIGATVMQALVANALDVGIGDVIQVANTANAGVGVAIFAGGALYASDAPATLLCTAKNSTARVAKDLEGQTIGVIQLASLSALAVREWMRQNGADLEKVRIIEIPFGSMTAALDRGQVAAAMIAEPFLSDARADVRVLAKAYDAIAKSFYISTFMAKRDWLQQNAEVARRIARALYESAQWANLHRDDSAPILAKYAKLELDRVRSMTRTSFAVSLEERQMQPVLDVGYRYHQLTKPVNATDLIVRLPA